MTAAAGLGRKTACEWCGVGWWGWWGWGGVASVELRPIGLVEWICWGLVGGFSCDGAV